MKLSVLCISGFVFAAMGSVARAEVIELSIESWRNDDTRVWEDVILPRFNEKHPDIKVKFLPTNSNQYDASLGAKLDAGTAGDIITCRPFDVSLGMFEKGRLADLTGLTGMERFSALSKLAWASADGKSDFCVPMASVLHGFIYNKSVFQELGIKIPKTTNEFFQALEAVKKNGGYLPLAIGTAEEWSVASMGYQNIGPAYWKGETGRVALLRGTESLADPQWEKPFEIIQKWSAYMGKGFEARTYADSQNLFTLGRAAIYPAGSWEIAPFQAQHPDFEMGAFPPPVNAEGKCYVTDHPDIAMGMNAATKHPEAVKAFLSWVASQDFAQIYADALPGFFPLINAPIEVKNELAADFLNMRKDCETTIRPFYQALSAGNPSIEEFNKVMSAAVINGTVTPAEAAKRQRDAMASWYRPKSH